MELKEFIHQTVSAIAEASATLQEELGKVGHVVNPPTSAENKKNFGMSSNFRYFRVQDIEFDVMVTAGSEDTGSAGGGISVLSMEIGASRAKENRSETVNRLRFSIPLALRPSPELQTNADAFENEEKQSAQKRAKALTSGVSGEG